MAMFGDSPVTAVDIESVWRKASGTRSEEVRALCSTGKEAGQTA